MNRGCIVLYIHARNGNTQIVGKLQTPPLLPQKKNFSILNLEYNFLYEESSLSLVIEDVVSAYVEEPSPHLYLHLLRISSAPRATGARYDFVFAWLFIIYCILGQ